VIQKAAAVVGTKKKKTLRGARQSRSSTCLQRKRSECEGGKEGLKDVTPDKPLKNKVAEEKERHSPHVWHRTPPNNNSTNNGCAAGSSSPGGRHVGDVDGVYKRVQ
jgi:hypothetical protein